MKPEYINDDQKAANALIGRTVRAVWVADGEEMLAFDTDGGDVVWGTYADCCSETWFSDIQNFDALIGTPVLAVELLELKRETPSRQEYDSFYGVRVKTAKGDCDIAYRNSSNGYYGGSMELSSSPVPGNAREIKGDWQA